MRDRKVTAYFVVHGSPGGLWRDDYLDFFDEKVAQALRDGWQPYGSIVVDNGRFYQVMVEYEE